MLKRIFSLVCAILLLLSFSALCLPSVAAEQDNGTTEVTFYGREALATLDNSAALLLAYDNIVEGVEQYRESIDVWDGNQPISVDEIQTVFDAYRRDHTEHFWLENSYSINHNSVTVSSLVPKYTFSAEELPAARVAFNSALASFIAELDTESDEFERELYLHDLLASAVSYDDEGKGRSPHTAYGALVEGLAVCEGYAEAFQCLLRAAGIKSFIIIGEATDPTLAEPQLHAWNAVSIDGKYYNVDPTWNDQGSKLYHAYFNLTDAALGDDHTPDATAYPLPVCNSDDAFYFKRKGGLVDTYTVNSIAAALADGELTAHVYIADGSTATFISWWESKAGDIAAAAGIDSRFAYGHATLGREIILLLETCKHESTEKVNALAPTCEASGNIEYFRCDCGKYFKDAEANEEIVNRSSVIIYTRGHDWSVELEDASTQKHKATDCTEHDQYFYTCAECEAVSDLYYFESAATGKHSPVKVAQKNSTCKEEGKLAYYSCKCGKHFKDLTAKDEIEDIDNYGIILKVSHSDENGDGICDVCIQAVSPVSRAAIIIGGVLVGLSAICAVAFALYLRKRGTRINEGDI